MTNTRKGQTSKAKAEPKEKKEKVKEFKEIDLSGVGSKIDVDQALKKSEGLKEIALGPQYFPNERSMEGEFIEGIYMGTIPFKNEETGEQYHGVVIAKSAKEKVVCISQKAVERLDSINPGRKVKLTYLGDIRTGGGFVMRNISVSYFD